MNAQSSGSVKSPQRAAPAKSKKITYSTMGADLDEFHKLFDAGLARVRAQLGRSHPLYIDGKPINPKRPGLEDRSPVDGALLGTFAQAGPEDAAQAVLAAKKAQKGWAAAPLPERLAVLRRAAEQIRERKYEIAAVMTLEVGKSRMESMGEVEEAADLVDYYAKQMEDARGYVRPMDRLSPQERTESVLRPFGVFAVIAPFNFPLALSTGMASGALTAGNAVVFKPSQETPWTGLLLYECFAKAGLPAGVFNLLTGRSSIVGDGFWRSSDVDGVVFTGSKDVGMRLLKEAFSGYPKPVLLEMGGKNAAIVAESADLEAAAEGIVRSAFGLQGQKCSACSRVYADKKIAAPLLEKILEKARKLKIGDPSQKDVFLGPVISEKAARTFEEAVQEARRGGKILAGGNRLKDGLFAKGHFVEPTIAQLPLDHPLFFKELFVPFLAFAPVSGLQEAIRETNKSEYGLTAGIFTGKKEEIELFFSEVEAGVCYANRKAGATTGAWPGVQPFCGWKGSGSTGKGGLGPYYVAQFMREQSRTVVEPA